MEITFTKEQILAIKLLLGKVDRVTYRFAEDIDNTYKDELEFLLKNEIIFLLDKLPIKEG